MDQCPDPLLSEADQPLATSCLHISLFMIPCPTARTLPRLLASSANRTAPVRARSSVETYERPFPL
jgi:hypothetical protein